MPGETAASRRPSRKPADPGAPSGAWFVVANSRQVAPAPSTVSVLSTSVRTPNLVGHDQEEMVV